MKILTAVKRVGSQAELARIVGCTRAAVSIWLKRGKTDMPELYLYRLRARRPEWFK